MRLTCRLIILDWLTAAVTGSLTLTRARRLCHWPTLSLAAGWLTMTRTAAVTGSLTWTRYGLADSVTGRLCHWPQDDSPWHKNSHTTPHETHKHTHWLASNRHSPYTNTRTHETHTNTLTKNTYIHTRHASTRMHTCTHRHTPARAGKPTPAAWRHPHQHRP